MRMTAEAYEDWLSIYNDDLREKWESEKMELKKITMIYCAFENELNKLKTSMGNEIREIKSELKRKVFLQKRKNFSGLAETLDFGFNLESNNKENEMIGIVPLKEIHQNEPESEKIVIESPETLAFFDNRRSPPLATANTEATSPILCKYSSRKRNSPPTPSLILHPMVKHKLNKSPETSGRRFESPQNCDDSNILESSIIEGTPEIIQLKKAKTSKLSLVKKTKKKISPKKQNSTLTQMFLEPKKKRKKAIDSNGPSMSVSGIIDLINQSSGSETDDGLDKHDDITADNLQEAANITKDKKTSDIPLSFIDNYNKFPDKDNKNPKFIYQDVVRGKERNKLKGWACSECENYYKGLNLPAAELEKKKDHCSRHRHRFQAREDTFQGFWDLTFGPSPKTQEKSLDSDFKKK